MPRDCCKSPEGVAEYKRIGQSYEDELWDQNYDKFLNLTKRTPAKEAKMEIQNMSRLVLPTGEDTSLRGSK